MATVEFENHEACLLSEVISSYLSELRMEIADTDLKDFRDKLKERKVMLMEIAAKIEGAIDS
ncbi:MAG: hypothetical protein C0608_08490 [Deltaproteobacteria bacterium]|nr:MAG: hypothetical protein C0608_08490 [Deltaproteobacteria bacterium]